MSLVYVFSCDSLFIILLSNTNVNNFFKKILWYLYQKNEDHFSPQNMVFIYEENHYIYTFPIYKNISRPVLIEDFYSFSQIFIQKTCFSSLDHFL